MLVGVLAATGNASFGYFGGGHPAKSTVDRIDYSNDTATASPKGPLSVARYALAATGNSFLWLLWWWFSWSKINSRSY